MPLYAVRLGTGETVLRFDIDPAVGETIDDSQLLDRDPAPFEIFDWTARALIYPPIAPLEAAILAAIDAERKRRNNAVLVPDPDPIRQLEIFRKGDEAKNDTGPWPWLSDLAAESGTTVEDERLAVLEAMDQTERDVIRIGSIAVNAKRAVRQAATVGAKLAAFHNIAWP